MTTFDFSLIQKAREEGTADEKDARQKSAEVQSAIAFLEMTSGENRATRERLREKIQAARACLESNKFHENPTVRREVWKALISFNLFREFSSKKEVEETIAFMVSEKLFLEDPKGTLTVLGKSYTVSAESFFEEEDLAEINRQFEVFKRQVRKVLEQVATLSVNDMLAGKEGQLNLFVPPEKFTTGLGPRWRAGGVLIVKSESGYLAPVEIIGSSKIVNEVSEAAKLGVKISTRSLSWTNPPTLTEKTEKNAKTQMFWHLVKRGIAFDRWISKAKFQAKLTANDFFIEKKIGMCLLDFEEAWQDLLPDGKEIWISRPVLLMERTEQNGIKCIQIRGIPKHLEDWVQNCQEPYTEREKFEGIPQPLQRFLRAMYGKTTDNSRKLFSTETGLNKLANT
ncbi:MAG: hypothetical protein PHF44_01525 [Candidatus Pacebacteria bacterium]|nr:hypothetical protein [Candidatus Paceibacterota bacterium]